MSVCVCVCVCVCVFKLVWLNKIKSLLFWRLKIFLSSLLVSFSFDVTILPSIKGFSKRTIYDKSCTFGSYPNSYQDRMYMFQSYILDASRRSSVMLLSSLPISGYFCIISAPTVTPVWLWKRQAASVIATSYARASTKAKKNLNKGRTSAVLICILWLKLFNIYTKRLFGFCFHRKWGLFLWPEWG